MAETMWPAPSVPVPLRSSGSLPAVVGNRDSQAETVRPHSREVVTTLDSVGHATGRPLGAQKNEMLAFWVLGTDLRRLPEVTALSEAACALGQTSPSAQYPTPLLSASLLGCVPQQGATASHSCHFGSIAV